MKRWLVGVMGALLALGATGCASARSQEKALLERTSSHVVYDLPAQQVMDAAEAELAERGYSLLPSTDPLFLHTPWAVSGNFDMGARWSRSYVEARKLPDGRLVVRAFKLSATTFGRTQTLPIQGVSVPTAPEEQPNTTPTVLLAAEPVLPRSARPVIRRDLELEWAIMERVNPQFAQRVKEQVDVYLAHAQGKR